MVLVTENTLCIFNYTILRNTISSFVCQSENKCACFGFNVEVDQERSWLLYWEVKGAQAVRNAKYERFVDAFLISAKLADKQLKNKDQLVLHQLNAFNVKVQQMLEDGTAAPPQCVPVIILCIHRASVALFTPFVESLQGLPPFNNHKMIQPSCRVCTPRWVGRGNEQRERMWRRR